MRTKVRDVMTQVLMYCFEDDDVAAAMRHMHEQQIRHLVVLDRHRSLVEMVSLYAFGSADQR